MKKQIKPKLKNKEVDLFINSTEDQFPYIEAAISVMDSNLKWWHKNWSKIQETIEDAFYAEMKKSFESLTDDNKIRTKFTIYSGMDNTSKDVKFIGPAIEYIFRGATATIVKGIQKTLEETGVIRGHKSFVEGNKLVIMF